MDISKLKIKYKELKALEDSDDGIFEFKNLLLKDDDEDVLQFHIDILNDRDDPYLVRDIRSFFSKRKDQKKVSAFIATKIKDGIENPLLKADLIQILGNLRSPLVKEIVHDEIKSANRDIRYRCIIVMGWVGTTMTDLDVLNERMINDEDGQLRGYAATAMRQIWYNKKSVKNRVTKYIKEAIESEKDPEALTGMIITLQDLHKKKLGIKESNYGDVSGDVQEAKLKAIKMLSKLK
ncbi:HEAT repeat domain-containing protein [Zobellia roscoffensis]|uniref:HEAT repeat domain-containing protein n=1 Tax=Zobellia roscoffensis TaxID=2779508 RepID=UPI00188B7B4C|nr:HEAT repeat domain-containing protein [Zobellia roscoffensis]